jgi:hypothetical protein
MKFYRYETYQTCSYDSEYDTYSTSYPKLKPYEYSLHKETQKGYWIRLFELDYPPYRLKWIPKESRKRFAYPTKKEALDNFIHRTKASIRIMKARISVAEYALDRAEEEYSIVNEGGLTP